MAARLFRLIPALPRAVWLPSALGLVAACVTPLDIPVGRVIDPPAEYRIWWDEVERCVGKHRDFFEVEWLTGAPTTQDGDDLTGAWSPPRFIIMRPFYLTSEPAVKHEIVHHLTQGHLPHSAAVFQTCTRPIGQNVIINLGR